MSYELAPYATLVVSGKAPEAFKKLHAELLALQAVVEAPEATADKVKSDNPLSRFDKDEDGIAEATEFVNSIAEQIIAFCDDDAARTYHFANVFGERVGKYLSSELSYHKGTMTPKTATVNKRVEAKRSFNIIRKDVAALALIAKGMDPAFTSEFLTADGVSILKGYVGAKPAGDAVHGRYAKVYSLAWNIDGEDIEVSSLTDIVRYLWQGIDRIGKSAKDLGTLLDNVAPDWTKPSFVEQTFVCNGHNVTISRVTED